MNWAAFWKQFDAAIHSQCQLKDTEKLTYLKEAVNNKPAKNAIMGLAQTKDNYVEAVECLMQGTLWQTATDLPSSCSSHPWVNFVKGR